MPANQATISTKMLSQLKMSEMWLSETSMQKYLAQLSFSVIPGGNGGNKIYSLLFNEQLLCTRHGH